MKKIYLIIIFISAGLTASGQFEKIIQPSDLKQKTFVTESSTLNKGYFRAEAGIQYIVKDKYFNSSGKKEYYPVSTWGIRYNINFGLKYGISDKLEVDISLPLVHNRVENYFVLKQPVVNMDYSFSSNLRGFGIGDMNLMVKYQLLPEKEKRITLTMFADVTFPTGQKNPTDIKDFTDYRLPTGSGHYSAGLWVYARKIIYPYSFTVLSNYNYNFRGSRIMDVEDDTQTKFKKGNMFMAGGSFNLHLNEWIVLGNELYYFHYGKGEEMSVVSVMTDPAWNIEYVPKLIFQIRRFRISEIVGVPLFGTDSSADPAYTMSVQYTF